MIFKSEFQKSKQEKMDEKFSLKFIKTFQKYLVGPIKYVHTPLSEKNSFQLNTDQK